MLSPLLLAFIAACVVMAVTPGPNMALIIANTLRGGLRSGFVTLAGTATGLIILVTVAAVGMSSVMVLMADWFDVIRLAGAVYLAFLGARQLLRLRHDTSSDLPEPAGTGRHLYLQGLLVSLSNPKVLLFLGAFLPQFVEPGRAPLPQLVLLAILFVVTLVVVDAIYTIAVARARATFDRRRLRLLDAASGVLLLAGGLLLATARRP